jgi:hypothetical protein
MAEEGKEKKQAGLGSFIFVGCIIIGVGVGIGFDLMPAAVIIGFGVGFIGYGITRYVTGKW